MHKFTVYYSVGNGGDGSAYPQWMESQELVDWDQDHMTEGWGEPCNGSVTFTSESEIVPSFEILTKEGYYLDKTQGWDEFGSDKEREEYMELFFADGLPKMDVQIIDENYFMVSVDGKDVYKSYSGNGTSDKRAAKLQKEINS